MEEANHQTFYVGSGALNGVGGGHEAQVRGGRRHWGGMCLFRIRLLFCGRPDAGTGLRTAHAQWIASPEFSPCVGLAGNLANGS